MAKGICRQIIVFLIQLNDWIGRANAWLLVPMTMAVIAAVILSQLKISQLFLWDTELPLFGKQLTVASLAELQWHLFGIFVLIGGSWVLQSDRHVRVDLLYVRFPPVWQHVVNMLGDLLFLLPFCAVVFWFSLSLVQRSYLAGEGSDYDALVDRYLIKSVLPAAFGLLFLNGVLRIVQTALQIRELLRCDHTQKST